MRNSSFDKPTGGVDEIVEPLIQESHLRLPG
jgi:hypothetical protein